MNNSETNHTSLFPILLVNFIGTLGFSIVLPFLVFLVTRFGGNAFIYGLIGATYPLFQMVGAPLLGRWSDLYGRRKILLVSQAGTLLSWIIFCVALFVPVTKLLKPDNFITGAFTLTIPLIIVFMARALDGLTGGNISVANAYLSDITPLDKRNENFGKMSISSNLGFVFGPAVAGLLGATSYGEILPVFAATLISLVATFLIIFYLPESKPVAENNKKAEETHLAHKQILKLQGIRLILVIYFLIFLGFNFFYTAFPVFAVEKLQWDVSQTGLFFTLLSLMMVVVQGPVLRRAGKRFADKTLILVGGIILGCNFLLLITENLYLVYFAAVLFALGNGVMWPSVLALLSKTTPEDYQGAVQGFASSAGSAASIIGLISGGFLYTLIYQNIFIFSAAIIFLASFMVLVHKKTKK